MAQQSRGTAEKSLFVRDTRAVQKLLLWVLASCALLALDAKTPLFNGARAALSSPVGALYFVAEAPYMFGNQAADALASRRALVEKNAELGREILKLRALTSRYDAVERENARLRELLGSRTRVRDDMLVAELVGASSMPQEIIVDKGTLSGVEAGQAVVDSAGVLGQVVETAQFTSRVLLITDPTHSVPVRVLRNDVLSIATGTGDGLALKDVAVTLDIVPGDELVSSGLGDRFPPNYPVGVVDSVLRDQTEPFANIVLRPKASVNRTPQVLVVIGTNAAPPQQIVADVDVPGLDDADGAISGEDAMLDEDAGETASHGEPSDGDSAIGDSATSTDSAASTEDADSADNATSANDAANTDDAASTDSAPSADDATSTDDVVSVDGAASTDNAVSSDDAASSDDAESNAASDDDVPSSDGATSADDALSAAATGEDGP